MNYSPHQVALRPPHLKQLREVLLRAWLAGFVEERFQQFNPGIQFTLEHLKRRGRVEPLLDIPSEAG